MTCRPSRALFVLALFALAGGGCKKSDPPPGVTSVGSDTSASPGAKGSGMGGERVSLGINIPHPVGAVRIAAGNVWEEDFTPDGGAPQKGLTAQLWILNEDPGKNTAFRVYPGQVFKVPGAEVQVVSIDAKGVQIDVKSAR